MNRSGRDDRLVEQARLRGLLSWRFLLFGVRNHLISASTAVHEAERAAAETNEATSGLVDLASLLPGEEGQVDKALAALADESGRGDDQLLRDSWRFVILRDLRECETDNEILLEKVAAVYRDFDYPPDMRDAVYYMPPIGQENAQMGAVLVSPLRALDKLLDTLSDNLTLKRNAPR